MANAPVVIDKKRNIEWQPNKLENWLFEHANTAKGAAIFGTITVVGMEAHLIWDRS